jgi:large subunit ribosomal protein L10
MTKQAKEEMVSDLTERLGRAKAALIFNYSGLDVAAVTEIRRTFRDADVDYKVVKNTLMKRALAGTPIESIGSAFRGTTAVAFKYDEEFGKLGKTAKELTKKFDKLEAKAGFVEEDVINDPRALNVMASLPTLDEARSQLLGVLNAPAAKLLAQLNAPAASLLSVVEAWVDKRKDGGEG